MDSSEQAEVHGVRKVQPLRRLYDWVLHWAETPYGPWALFILAFCESSFFPIPPDVLLIALAISIAKKSFRYALICSVGSVLGGCFGYFIGYEFFEHVGKPIIHLYGVGDKFELVSQQYQNNAFVAVAIAGFTPIPYKVFTIAAGACSVNFLTFVIASAISRSARFFIIAALIYLFGGRIKNFIDRYFNVISIAFVVLLIGGFAIIKLLR
ncbi:MAG TPA: YqaA family protein [Candidatus Brocadiia bacterium]|nr:DedA family protein [Planctomycetota bacterium]MBI4007861.1 DedA family protein [Planctomycetota bacterium]MDO8092145.1 YqaA family protein [Candidatus Brocadiales bacterium]